MTPRPFLLRLLLCIALVLNGIAPAGASLRQGARAACGTHAAADRSGSADRMAAHRVAETASLPHHHAARTSQPESAELATSAARACDPGDCCSEGACGGSCAQHCAASIPPPLDVRAVALVSDDAARALPAGHRAPSLPHLIRPPIA